MIGLCILIYSTNSFILILHEYYKTIKYIIIIFKTNMDVINKEVRNSVFDYFKTFLKI